jgi:DNA-binding beta-propeller fold protein YncE
LIISEVVENFDSAAVKAERLLLISAVMNMKSRKAPPYDSLRWIFATVLGLCLVLGQSAATASEATLPLEGDWMGVGFGSFWEPSGGFLNRIDPQTNTIVARISLGGHGPYRGVAIADSSVWIANIGNQTVYKIDPRSNKIVLSLSLKISGSEGSLACGDGRIWLATDDERGNPAHLLRINEADGAIEGSVELPGAVNGAVFAEGRVWLTATNEDKVYVVDAISNRLVKQISVGERPRFAAVGAGSVWILNQGNGHLVRLKPSAAEIAADVDIGAVGSGGDITYADGFVWVSTRAFPVIKFDPAIQAVVAKVPQSEARYGDAIRVGFGSVWISGAVLHRLTPP